MKFKSVEERDEAIDQLGEIDFNNPQDPNIAKMEEIAGSEIDPKYVPETGDTPPADGADPGEPGEPTEPKPPEEGDPAAAAEETFTISSKDLQGYKNVGEFLKAHSNLKDTFERQQEFIRNKLSEKKPEPAPAAPVVPPPQETVLEGADHGTKVEITDVSKKIGVIKTEYSGVMEKRRALAEKVDSDPDYWYTDEYRKEMATLDNKRDELIMQHTGLSEDLNSLLVKAQTEAAEAKNHIATFNEREENEKRTKAQIDARNKAYTALDTIEVPELKLGKPSREAEADYVKWRSDVGLAYYGEPVEDTAKLNEAMRQLELGNPDLVQKCAMIKAPTKATPDIERYLEGCRMLSYMEGWRQDPATGEWSQLMVVKDGKQIPYRHNSLADAVEDYRRATGYYQKRAENGFQDGADAFAAATMRRDQGAVELGGEDQRRSTHNQEWAIKTINEIDVEAANRKAANGDSTDLNKHNEAMTILATVFEA